MAISGSGGWIPSVRLRVRGRKVLLDQISHNVPPEVCWHPEHAAAYFIDNPDAYIYVATFRWGGVHYLNDLLRELDLID